MHGHMAHLSASKSSQGSICNYAVLQEGIYERGQVCGKNLKSKAWGQANSTFPIVRRKKNQAALHWCLPINMGIITLMVLWYICWSSSGFQDMAWIDLHVLGLSEWRDHKNHEEVSSRSCNAHDSIELFLAAVMHKTANQTKEWRGWRA